MSASPIFIVDRDRHVRDLLQDYLAPFESPLRFLNDGASALSAAREEAPRLVITEVLVPRLDGFGLCRALKREVGEVPLIVLSIVSAEDRAALAGADAFLLKPVERRRLCDAVSALLRVPPLACLEGGRP